MKFTCVLVFLLFKCSIYKNKNVDLLKPISNEEYISILDQNYENEISKKSVNFANNFYKKQKTDSRELRKVITSFKRYKDFDSLKEEVLILLNMELKSLSIFNDQIKDLKRVDFSENAYLIHKTGVSYPVYQNYTDIIIKISIDNIDRIFDIIKDKNQFEKIFNGKMDFLKDEDILSNEQSIKVNKVSIILTMFAILKVESPDKYNSYIKNFNNKKSSLFYLYQMPFGKSLRDGSFLRYNDNFIHFHSGYSFGGSINSKNMRSELYTMPHDCSTFVDIISNFYNKKGEDSLIFTYDMMNMYNLSKRDGFLDLDTISENLSKYGDFFKKFDFFDINYFNIDDLMSGDILFWRSFKDERSKKYSNGFSGHVFVVLGHNGSNVYGFSYLRDFNKFSKSGPVVNSFDFDILKNNKERKASIMRYRDAKFTDSKNMIKIDINNDECILSYNSHSFNCYFSKINKFNADRDYIYNYFLFNKSFAETSLYINLQKEEINENDVWCKDLNSHYYNSLIKSSESSCISVQKISNYDSILVSKDKNAATFFIIGSDKNDIETEDSVVITKRDMLKLLPLIDSKSKLKISINN